MSQDVPLERRTLESQVEWLTLQVGVLTARLNTMERDRKGGRPRKEIKVIAEGICGLDPERDSAHCPDASLYRRRQGCQGDACRWASSTYYKKIRDDIAEVAVVPVDYPDPLTMEDWENG